MAIEYINAIWELPSLSPTLKFVLLKLGDNADENGVCWPSVRHIAERCGLSQRCVQEKLRELERLHYITCEMRPHRSTLYRLDIPGTRRRAKAAEIAPPPTPQPAHRDPAPDSPRTVTEPSIKPPNPLKGESKGVKGERTSRTGRATRRDTVVWSDPAYHLWPLRVENFYRTGFWLSSYGKKPNEKGNLVPPEFNRPPC